jgi:hypothetical protein
MSSFALVVAFTLLASAASVRQNHEFTTETNTSEGKGLWKQCCVKHGFDVGFDDATYQELGKQVAKFLAYTGAYDVPDKKAGTHTQIMYMHFQNGLRLPKESMPPMMDLVINAWKMLETETEKANGESNGLHAAKTFVADYAAIEQTYSFQKDKCPLNYDETTSNKGRCSTGFVHVIELAKTWIGRKTRLNEIQIQLSSLQSELQKLKADQYAAATTLVPFTA